MSTLDLSPDEFRTLESLRQRLATLTSNLKSLQDNVASRSVSSPLPTPKSLQATARIAQQNIDSLQVLLSDRQDLFARLAVHPSTNFPGREHEGTMQILLRKRLEPDVETWTEKARETAVEAGIDAGMFGGKGKKEERERRRGGAPAAAEEEDEEDEDEDEDEDEEGYRPEDEDEGAGGGDPLADLWADVRDAVLARIREFVEGENEDVYTAEEREIGVENVRTGLRRDLEEEDDDEEESEDEDENGDGVAGKGKAAVEEDEDVVMLGDGGAAPVQQTVPKPPAPQQPAAGFEPQHGMWFAARGTVDLPRTIETERQRMAREVMERSRLR